MPYVGVAPSAGLFKKLDAITVVNGQAAYTMQHNSSNYKPATANALLVSVNGVIQAAGDAYTINGSTITFTENLSTGDTINFIIALGDTGSAVTPVDGSVTTAKLANDAVTSDKLAHDLAVQTSLSVPTIKDSSGTNTAMTIASSGKVSFPNSVTLPAPMTNTWHITSSKSGGGDITANWAKTTYYNTASSGTDMTESSGVFTFPETGIYTVEFTACLISTSADDTIEANIKATVDGTNYATIGQIKTGTEPGGYKKSAFVKAIFDVTSTTTHKVKFNINSFAGTVDADSNFPLTGVFFTRIGST